MENLELATLETEIIENIRKTKAASLELASLSTA